MKILWHTVESFSAYGRKKISLREEINFLPYGNKFLCGRKFHGMREEIFQHAEAEKSQGEKGWKRKPYPMIVYRANFSSNIF